MRSGLLVTAALVGLSQTQTIKSNGKAVDVSEVNVIPAADVPADAPSAEYEALQLTDEVLANLTDLELSHIELFGFDDEETAEIEKRANKCKTYPGDLLYPSKAAWKVFDLLTGGRLIKTVPYASVCYEGERYDADKCQFLLDNWNQSTTHVVDPTSVMSPQFQGASCEPSDAALGGNCTMGGFPAYSVNVTNVAQIQLAVNFARSLNLRLVIHNTGHDFLGKSTGKDALSIWTHNMQDIETIHEYKSSGGSYEGPAMKLGAGVMVQDLYEVAEKEGYTAVAGECRTVGVTGGYLAGGGHSPVTPVFGLGSDQVLSVDIVLPNGRFVTADETQNTDLFWAVRGGGAATWGVVVSMTVKVHKKMVFSGMEWDTTTVAMNITDETFWKAIEAYWTRYPEYSDKHSYGYCRMSSLPGGGYAWRAKPFMVPGMKLVDYKKMVQPLLDDWEALGATPNIKFFEYESLYPAWKNHFPPERVGSPFARTASRLIPRKNWDDKATMKKTIETVRGIVEEGAFLVHYNMNAEEPEGTVASAANPAWRDNLMFVIIGLIWDGETPEVERAAFHEKLTNDLAQRLKDISPGAGGYGNEGDLMDPEFQQSFYGSNYERLAALKRKIDPRDVFWAPTAVGSENWYITDQKDYVTWQTGKLCRR
ncbi:FAD binding domain-containing protein [Sarocladium implicatum]|nr:FAD binding domain-containing protein [Sarocladium implicatum]